MVPIPEPHIDGLCEIYHPKKVTLASLEIVDTPGLSRSHEGSAGKLALIREAGCLVVVVAAFGGNDAAADLTSFEDDLLLADMDLVTRRLERLAEQFKKARGEQIKQVEEEQAALEPLLAALEAGEALRTLDLTPPQEKVIRSFQLLTEKPRLVIFNTPEDKADVDKFRSLVPADTPVFAIPLDLERELAGMDAAERTAFYEEMGAQPSDRDQLIRTLLETSGQMLFLTAGDKEVRTWLIPRGATAVDAAGSIHTDLARGFIRAEVMQVEDLLRLGSEREIKAHNLMRSEHKDYVIQDGDVLLIRHN
jgi:ribosome-binding ATPase YchF (GTP1/OBG family)